MAEDLGFSLGKLNYCLNALKNKGFIKINNFKRKKIKLNIFNIFLPQRYSRKNKSNYKFHEKKNERI